MTNETIWTEAFTHNVLAHIRARIEQTPITEFPFAHLCIHQFFPESLYRMLLERFPGMPPGVPSGSDTSGVDLLDPNNDIHLSETQRDAWVPIRDFIYPKIYEMLECKLQHLLKQRVDELHGLGVFFPEKKPSVHNGKVEGGKYGFMLLERTEKFGIVPHIHGPYEYMNILHYFPGDDKSAFAGTQIYSLRSPLALGVLPGDYSHISHDALSDPILVPFIPNVALIWVSNFRAIHGRTALPHMPTRRYIFGYTLFAKDNIDRGVLDPKDRGPLKVLVEP